MKFSERHDLVIVGGGPAGVAAAINAESERLDTIVLDSGTRVGGQAGTSSFIENYPGFAKGISGDALMAEMVDQALRFDTEFMGPTRVAKVEPTGDGIKFTTDEMDTYEGMFGLIAAGVEYRRLKARNLGAYLGRGAMYGSPVQSEKFASNEIYVVGGANSAGQAAVHLAEFEACKVNILIRGESIESGMSGYLIDKIRERKNITVHTETELAGVDGNGKLETVMLTRDGETENRPADHVFVLIGSTPKTEWLNGTVERDAKGFVVTGSDMTAEQREAFREKTEREPFAHETSQPGLFAAGDVRAGTSKRVALAVGDGAAVVPELHRARALAS